MVFAYFWHIKIINLSCKLYDDCMSSTAHGKRPVALRLSMKKQKGKNQAQKTRYTANSIKAVPVGQNFKTLTSKREKHVGLAYCLL